MIGNNKSRANRSVIGIMLMICITVILASVIAAFIFGMGNFISPRYDATIIVKDVLYTNGNRGVIDTNNNGYYFDSFHSFVKGDTYHITYYIANDRRFIISEKNINDIDDSDLFKCKYIDGVCK